MQVESETGRARARVAVEEKDGGSGSGFEERIVSPLVGVRVWLAEGSL